MVYWLLVEIIGFWILSLLDSCFPCFHFFPTSIFMCLILCDCWQRMDCFHFAYLIFTCSILEQRMDPYVTVCILSYETEITINLTKIKLVWYSFLVGVKFRFGLVAVFTISFFFGSVETWNFSQNRPNEPNAFRVVFFVFSYVKIWRFNIDIWHSWYGCLWKTEECWL